MCLCGWIATKSMNVYTISLLTAAVALHHGRDKLNQMQRDDELMILFALIFLLLCCSVACQMHTMHSMYSVWGGSSWTCSVHNATYARL